MIVEVFALCNTAVELPMLTLVNVFDTALVSGFPGTYQCSLAMRLRYDRTEAAAGKHRLSLHLAGGNSQPLGEVMAYEFSTPPLGGPDDSAAVDLVFRLGLQFQKSGKHTLDLAIDGKDVATLPLWAALAKS